MMSTREGEKVCTLAGILLFGRTPRRGLPQAGIRWMAFAGDSKESQALDDALLDGPLVALCRGSAEEGFESLKPGLIEQVIERMSPFISSESEQVDDGLRRRRIWHFPQEVVREAVLNALIHRDWSRLPAVEIVSYADRLEITSPGGLPNSMTLETMLAGRRLRRNTLLFDVMRDYGYADAGGMGVRRKIVPLIRSAAGQDVRFEATEHYVRVILPRARDKRDG